MTPTPSVTGLVLTVEYGRVEERDSMLTEQYFQIDRSRPATFLEELRGVVEVFAAALVIALVGVALIAVL